MIENRTSRSGGVAWTRPQTHTHPLYFIYKINKMNRLFFMDVDDTYSVKQYMLKVILFRAKLFFRMIRYLIVLHLLQNLLRSTLS